MTRIIWSLIGVIMVIIGNVFKYSNIMFLGYYLMGTGNTRRLPEYYDELLVSMFAGIEPEDGDKLIMNSMDAISWDDEINHHNMYLKLFETIGKFKAECKDGVIYITDDYKFYPLCEESDKHFSDCNCNPDNKEYSHLHKHLVINNKIIYKTVKLITDLKKTPCICFINTDFVTLRLSTYSLSLEINDEFWVTKGKEFKVVYELPIA